MSTITKQAVQAVADLKAGYTLGHADVAILNELARIALASMEAKSRKLFTCSGCGAEGLDEPLESKCHCNEDGAHWVESVVYTAPPAPVSVPDFPEILPCPVILEPGLRFGKGVPTKAMLGALQRRAEHYAELEAMTPEQRAKHDAGMKEFAAMIQGADRPQNETQNIPENIPATQFKPVADLYGLTSPTGSETSFTFDAVEARDFIDGGWLCQEYVELGRFQEAMLQNGNSPAQSDCCPEQNYIAPAQDGDYPVIPDGLRLALSNAGIAAPESDEMLAATCEKHIQALVTWVKDRKPFRSAVVSDCWVACSERMPEVGSTIMVFMDKPQHSATDYAITTFDKYGFSRAKVTHWQPLPAAPQQEVKPL